jgi:WD40 repeat protein
VLQFGTVRIDSLGCRCISHFAYLFSIAQDCHMPLTNATSQSRMQRRVIKILSGAVLVAGAIVMLVNCGGGGGGADSGTKSSPGGTINPGLSGKLWQPSLDVGYVQYITDANTGNTIKTKFSYVRDDLVSVGRDGRLFASQNISANLDTSIVTIHPVPKTQVEDPVANLGALSFNSTIQVVSLSPDSRYLALIYADGTSRVSTKNGLYIYDLQNQADVNAIDFKLIHDTKMSTTQIMSFDWMPGGEYRYIYVDDRIMRGSVTNPSQADKLAGKIVAPAGLKTGDQFAISPDGKQIATSFSRNKKPGEVYDSYEVWLTDITGGNPQQVTTGLDAILPVWSPDGQFLAVASGRVGKLDSENDLCRRKYIPSTARNVPADGRQQIRHTPFGKPFLYDMGCPPIDFYWTK